MIRLAVKEDTSQIKDLWNCCFDDTPEFTDFFFDNCYFPQNTLVSEENGIIQSSLQMLPYKMHLRNREVPVSYIVGVGTWPEYRGQGLAKELLQKAGYVLQERGFDISILLPFQYDFYRKYGWEICYDLLIYNDMESAPITFPSLNQQEVITKKEIFQSIELERDWRKLSDCYNKYMTRYNGYLLRSSKKWKTIIRDMELDNGFAYIYENNKEPQGYILYTISDKTLTIQELVHTTAAAKHNLLQLALSHASQADHIIRRAPFWDTDYLSMADSRGKLEKQTFVMGRIHNPIEAISGLSYIGKPFVIQVMDNFYQENNGSYEVNEQDGHAKLTKVKQKPDLIMDIQTLSQLLWGYISPENAYSDSRLFSYDEEVLEDIKRLFPVMCNYMTEIY
ncbi:MAG TPA: hypothetical protein DIW17_16610 [Clostridiales bacterium]|nr:hypothetical protein [Clostridiales bacterium]